MADVIAVKPAPPLAQRSAAVHAVLGLIALGLLFAARMPRFAQYADLITGVCAVFGVGTVAAARAYLGDRILAIIDAFSPTPPKVTAGTIIASQEMKP